MTVVAFGALMWEKCAQSHSFGLGRVGGGGYHWGGGVGEPRTGIIYRVRLPRLTGDYVQAASASFSLPGNLRFLGSAKAGLFLLLCLPADRPFRCARHGIFISHGKLQVQQTCLQLTWRLSEEGTLV